MKNQLSRIGLGALAAIAVALVGGQAHAQIDTSLPTFTCDGTRYMAIEEGASQQLYELGGAAAGGVSFDPVGSRVPKYNAIGYDKTRNYIIGARGDDVIQVDSTGATTVIFSSVLSASNNVAGDVDRNGDYWVLTRATRAFDRVNLSTGAVTVVSIDAGASSAGSGRLAGVTDFSFSPINGKAYGYDGASKRVIEITFAGGSYTLVELPTVNALSGIGSSFFDSGGRLFGYGSDTGTHDTLYQMDTITGAVTVVDDGPDGPQSDGASCPFNLGFEKVATEELVAGGTATYRFTLNNFTGGALTGITFEDVLPAGYSWVGTISAVTTPSGVAASTVMGSVSGRTLDVSFVPNLGDGTTTFEATVRAAADPSLLGDFCNQANLEGVPVEFATGGVAPSDDPSTVTILGDCTNVEVMECSGSVSSLCDSNASCVSDECVCDAGFLGNGLDGECCADCRIGGECFDDGEANPSNACQTCDVGDSRTSFTADASCRPCATNADCGGAVPVCDVGAGVCVECVADGDCTSGTCSAMNVCVGCATDAECAAADADLPICLDSGDCAECGEDSDCSGTTPFCGGSNTCRGCNRDSECAALDPANPICEGRLCVECGADSDCSGATPFCNTGTNMCGGCTTDAQCAAADADLPFCDPDGACVECNADGDCPAGEFCNAMNVCAGCSTDAECAAADPLLPICDAGTGSCVECAMNGDCDAAEFCNANVCGGCIDDDQCAARDADLPICDEATGGCVECTADSECTSVDAPFCGDDNVCRGCADDAECAAADADFPICAEGDCVECGDNADCGGDEPVCNPATNMCAPGCVTNDDCPSEMPVCDTDTNACVVCLTNADCTEDGLGVCLMGTACVECAGAGGCPDGFACNDANMCVETGCGSDADCTEAGLGVCDTDDGECYRCIEDADCDAGQVCTSERACVDTGCTSDADCGGVTPICDTASGDCVTCLVDTDCAEGETCDLATNTCVAAGCASDADCTDPANPICDVATGDCGPSDVVVDPDLGLSGGALCASTSAGQNGGTGVAFALLGLLGLAIRRRR